MRKRVCYEKSKKMCIRDRCYADALVDDGDAVLLADAVHNRDEIAREAGDLVVDLLARLVRVRVDAVQQADACLLYTSRCV